MSHGKTVTKAVFSVFSILVIEFSFIHKAGLLLVVEYCDSVEDLPQHRI